MDMNAKFTSCKLSTEIVPYLYGELSASASSTFESHLLDCSGCTDEFAAIAGARYEVYEWNQLEFVPMPTPRMEIPYDTANPHTESWLDRFRSVVGRSWALPGVAFAGLALVAAFAGMFAFSSDTNDTASVPSNSNLRAADNRPTVRESVKQPVVTDQVVRQELPEVHQPARMSTVKRVDAKRGTSTERTISPQTMGTRTKSTQDQPRRVPTLNEYFEDEDTSLRLAELFDDIETSD